MRTSKRVHNTVVATLLGLLLATPGLAQKGGFELAAGGGLMKLDNKLGGDTGGLLDLRAGYFVTDRFEIEVQSTQASSILEGSFDALTLNALYHFEIEGDFIPYVLVGAGTADTELDRPIFGAGDSRDFEDDGTALRVAVGGRFWFGDRYRPSIRLELSILNEDSFDNDATHAGISCVFGWRFGA